MRVFVLLFNAGTENEGIHTIKIGDRNKVLMFESEDDATRFAILLEAQDFPTATVDQFPEADIIDFCESVGYDYELIPEGELAIPPDANVEELDWDEEADINGEKKSGSPPSDLDAETEEQEFSDRELEQIRRRLEGLL